MSYVQECVNALVESLHDDKATPATVVSASKALLDLECVQAEIARLAAVPPLVANVLGADILRHDGERRE